MKYFVSLLFVFFAYNSFAMQSKCGVVSNLQWHHPDNDVDGLSGLFIKQSDRDIRVTRQAHGQSNGNINTAMMVALEKESTLKSLFICLDDYELYEKPYAGIKRLYASVFAYRVWINGELALESNKK